MPNHEPVAFISYARVADTDGMIPEFAKRLEAQVVAAGVPERSASSEMSTR